MTSTSTWQLLDDARFELTFRYPDPTPRGQQAHVVPGAYGEYERIHVLSEDRELYVEVVRVPPMSAEEEYRTHAAYLGERFGPDAVGALGHTTIAGRAAQAYRFRWPEGERTAIVVSTAGATYRIIYNSASALNEDVLATLAFRAGVL